MSNIHEKAFQVAQTVFVATPLLLLASTLLAMPIILGLFDRALPSPTQKEVDTALQIAEARDVSEICSVFGYRCEDHQVVTEDDYILGLKRILPRSTEELLVKRPVVFMQHGLCTNCELFMVSSHPERCLPLVLVENGFDVWLGNNRGNKYSKKHQTLSVESDTFWDFSVDDLAQSDIPSSVSYVLSTTGQPNLSYIGFSQGSAQAFAALSVNEELNSQVNLFIALAPIMRPKGYASRIVDFMTKYNPHCITSIFGTRALFPIVSRLQRILPTFVLHLAVDVATHQLLAFDNSKISYIQKRAAYPHLYCASSVKAVVHWGIVMKKGEFVPFVKDDINISEGKPADGDTRNCQNGTANGHVSSSLVPGERYPTERIRTPIVLIHGDNDSLFDPEPVLEHLPHDTVRCMVVEGYQHIDILWGANVHLDVIPKVLEALKGVS